MKRLNYNFVNEIFVSEISTLKNRMTNEIDESLFSDEPLSDQVFHQFLSLLRHKRQYARQIETEQGIKPRDFSVLRFLLDSGPATVSQVQAFLHNSPSTTSALIAQLEEAGYVSRRRSDEDNRVVIVSLEPRRVQKPHLDKFARGS